MANSSASGPSLPYYSSPPLIEVACGVSFEPIQKFKIPHYGLFWNQIKDEFPKVEHATRLGGLPKSFDSGSLPTPRIFFIHKEENHLIQLQEDRFLFNWRRLRPDDVYPRYEFVIKDFRIYLEKFARFLVQNELGDLSPKQCELTYINHMEKGNEWNSILEGGNVFAPFHWNVEDHPFLPEPDSISFNLSFSFPDNWGSLRSVLKHGARQSDGKELLILDQSARGIIPDCGVDELWTWFDAAHEWIVKGFSEITATNIQDDYWGKVK